MNVNLIAGALTALFLSTAVAETPVWVSAKDESSAVRNHTTVYQGNIAGLLCDPTTCIAYVRLPQSCIIGGKIPMLANSTTNMGIIQGKCINFLFNGVAMQILALTPPSTMDKAIQDKQVVNLAVPDKGSDIINYRLDFSKLTGVTIGGV